MKTTIFKTFYTDLNTIPPHEHTIDNQGEASSVTWTSFMGMTPKVSCSSIKK